MPDLKTHFRDIERVAPTDLWHEIELRAVEGLRVVGLDPERERSRANDRLRKVVTIAVALLLAIAAIGAAIQIFRSGARVRPADEPITPGNVGDLRLAWSALIPSRAGPHVIPDGMSVLVATGQSVSQFPIACQPAAIGPRTGGGCEPLWTFSPPGGLVGEVVPGEAMVFVHGKDTLFALPDGCRAETRSSTPACDPAWSAHVGFAGKELDLMVADGTVYALGYPDRLFAFRVDCSRVCDPTWVKEGPLSLVIADGVAYESNWDARTLTAIPTSCYGDASGCEPIWTWTAPRAGHSSQMYISGVRDGLVRVVVDGVTEYHLSVSCASGGATCSTPDPVSSRRSWVFPWEQPFGDQPLWAAGGVRYAFSGDHPLTIGAYSASCASSCAPLWATSADPWPVAGPWQDLTSVVSGDIGYFANGRNLVVFSPAWCAPDSTRACRAIKVLNDGFADWSNVSLENGVIWWGSAYGGSLRAYSAACLRDGGPCDALWSSEEVPALRSGVSPPLVAGGHVFVTSAGGVYVFAIPNSRNAPESGTSAFRTDPPILGVGLIALVLLAVGALAWRRRLA